MPPSSRARVRCTLRRHRTAVDELHEVADAAQASVAAFQSEADVGGHVAGLAHLAGCAELVRWDGGVLGDEGEDGGHVRAAESDQEEPVVGRFGQAGPRHSTRQAATP
jgi:hypothetical protein